MALTINYLTGASGLGDEEELSVMVDYVGGAYPIYIGEALPGTSVASAEWRIRKITYDGNNNPTSIFWADHTSTFTKVWSGRAAYDYTY